MSEIQSVNVYSVDEERLKYRVLVTAGKLLNYHNTGDFTFNLPPPTNFANNQNYNQCLIKLDSFTATPVDTVIHPQWADSNGGRKLGAVVIELDTPSSQTIKNSLIGPAGIIEEKGLNMIGGFKQLIPLQIVNVGHSGNGGGADPAVNGYGWVGIGSGISATDPILCGNIFGRHTRLRIIDPAVNKQVWIQDMLAPAPNEATYNFAFTVTMIPNDRSEGNV